MSGSNNSHDNNAAGNYGERTDNDFNRQASPSNPPPWNDPEQSWRYVDEKPEHVYTGECFFWAPRPRMKKKSWSHLRTPAAPQGTVPTPVATSNEPTNSVLDPLFPTSPPKNPVPAYIAPEDQPGAPDDATTTSLPPGGPTLWNSANILKLYIWKTLKKKGIGKILPLFPGETEESLHAAWKEHRAEGKRLFEERKSTYDGHNDAMEE